VTLRNRYRAQVAKPLLREKEISDDLPLGVTLPLKSDAFIPSLSRSCGTKLALPSVRKICGMDYPRNGIYPIFFGATSTHPTANFIPLLS